MAKFYKVQRFAADPDLMIPVRGTERSAGYDFQVAEDIIIPSYMQNFMKQKDVLDLDWEKIEPATLAEVGPMIKERGLKPTLVSTGMKCQLADNEYLELTVRSSSPLKYLLILANGVGK